MGRNVEIKARVEDLPALVGRVETLADQGPTILEQEDTFFHSPHGRLKLRRFADGTGELIFYQRPDTVEPEESRFVRSPVADPSSLTETLAGALGVRGTVRKTRTLYLVGPTRVHLDEVEGLGEFLELEVVLEPDQSKEQGLSVAQDLLERLEVPRQNLLAQAYIDLLEHRGAPSTVHRAEILGR